MKPDTVQQITELLRSKLDPRQVIIDRDIIEKYARDETSDLMHYPDIVIRARSAQDISSTVAICNHHKIPVTPRGAGTGVSGGSVPIYGGVVVSLELLNRIIEIDSDNMVAVVEPCVITGDIQKTALKYGLMYPPDPASLESCSIGGNVAENAGGPRAVKYGTTKDYVIGLECVLPDGSIISTGGKTVKNVTGYNLTGILLGSEGTLAVITKIFLRLIPLPAVTKDLLIPFVSIKNAIEAVQGILQNGVMPSVIEFMEHDAIQLVSSFLEGNIPFHNAGAHLFIQMDGDCEDSVYEGLQRISQTVGIDKDAIFVAESSTQKDRLWKARRSIREAITVQSPVFLAEDCVVPKASIPQFVTDLKKYFKTRQLRSMMFGHAGDGNIHIDVLKDTIPYDEWHKKLPGLKKEIYKRALSYGGTITGEHGIGYSKKDYLTMALSSQEIELHKRIKSAFDPNLILNPGKIF